MRRYVLHCCFFLSLTAASQSIDVTKVEASLDSLHGVDKAMAYYDLVSVYVRADLSKAKDVIGAARAFAAEHPDDMVR